MIARGDPARVQKTAEDTAVAGGSGNRLVGFRRWPLRGPRHSRRRSVTFACGQCGATLAFDGVRTQRCPYCDSPNFVERPPTPGLPDPQFVVTFIGDAAVARRALDRWLGSRTMFADSSLRRAKVEDLRGVYVPAYLYSAVARTDYTAQIGENYTETETYTTTDSQGKIDDRDPHGDAHRVSRARRRARRLRQRRDRHGVARASATPSSSGSSRSI